MAFKVLILVFWVAVFILKTQVRLKSGGSRYFAFNTFVSLKKKS